MKKITYLLFGLMLSVTASCQESRTVKVTVKVTVKDEDETPIEGVKSTVTFLGYSGAKTQRKKGLTDALGIFEASGEPQLRMNVRLEKDGYYSSKSGKLSRKNDHDLTYILRRIKNPTPLYAVKFSIHLPSTGKFYGFDFSARDWVAPHGKGKKVMCLFQMDTQVVSDNEHVQKLVMKFPNKGDGIVKVPPEKERPESGFTWLYQAPREDYQSTITFLRQRLPKKPLIFDAPGFSYALRVNTKLDEKGNMVSANYVRISKGLRLYGVLSPKPGFGFTYYFNPTPNDRNLEFDPSRNLFKGLDSMQRVNAP